MAVPREIENTIKYKGAKYNFHCLYGGTGYNCYLFIEDQKPCLWFVAGALELSTLLAIPHVGKTECPQIAALGKKFRDQLVFVLLGAAGLEVVEVEEVDLVVPAHGSGRNV